MVHPIHQPISIWMVQRLPSRMSVSHLFLSLIRLVSLTSTFAEFLRGVIEDPPPSFVVVAFEFVVQTVREGRICVFF